MRADRDTSSGGGADSPEDVVAASIRLEQRGDLRGAFEQLWYPGFASTVDFIGEELRIEDLVIGQSVPRSPAGLHHDWKRAVSVPVSYTHLAMTGAVTAGPWSARYVLVRNSDSDPWRIAAIETSPVHR